MRTNDGDVRVMPMTEATCETVKELTFLGKVAHQIKENRIEAMIVTILLYSTGLLEKAYVAGIGVC